MLRSASIARHEPLKEYLPNQRCHQIFIDARKVDDTKLQPNARTGQSPILTQIGMQMMEKVHGGELQQSYFSKDNWKTVEFGWIIRLETRS